MRVIQIQPIVPVSTRRIVNASMTVPVGKWARVIATAEMGFIGHLSSAYYKNISLRITPMNYDFILKSGDVVDFIYQITIPTVLVLNSIYFAKVDAGIYVNGIKTFTSLGHAQFTAGLAATALLPVNPVVNFLNISSNYSFYAMEYFNQ